MTDTATYDDIIVGAAMGRSLLTLLVMLLSAAAGQAQPTSTNESANAWVKLCEKQQQKGKDKDGREVTRDVDAYVTLTEKIHAESGAAMVSAKYHQVKIDGQEKRSFQVTVPLGAVLPAGLGVTVFPKNLWDKLLKNEKLGSPTRSAGGRAATPRSRPMPTFSAS
jgi:invasion protein IalB